MEAKEFLLKDLEQFSQALWRNEEVGEKRFSFFVTLVTAVAGGLVALGSSEKLTAQPQVVGAVAAWAALVLLILGLLTYVRMLQRNRVADELQGTLDYIRGLLTSGYPELAAYKVPRRKRKRFLGWLRGGYAETIGVIDGMLLTATLILGVRAGPWISGSAGALVAAALWVPSAIRKKWPPPTPTGQSFRAGAGAVLANGRGQLLVLERRDVAGAWQFPQGGLEQGEEPLDAVLREIREELGVQRDELELVARHPGPLAYELPAASRSERTGRGQVQYWFLFRFRAEAPAICLPPGGELRAHRWSTFDQVVAEVVEFRRPVYERLKECFFPLLVNPRPGTEV